MANKIIGTTDASGGISVVSNSSRSVLLVGVGTDTTKEVVFEIAGTTIAASHFGANAPFVSIVKTLIRNGVNNIKGICVGEYGESKPYATAADAYNAAYAKSMIYEDIRCILLDSTDSTLNTGLKAHLAAAEGENLFRYAAVGCPAATNTTTAVKTLATAISSNRMFIAYPNVVNDVGIVLDGIYTAAGIASVLMTKTDDPALPSNGVVIDGFGGIATKLLTEEQVDLASAGVIALYPENTQPAIYRMVTSAQKIDGKEDIYHEATTRLICDNVLESVEAKLKANYKRTKNVARVINSIKTDVIGVLNEKNGLEIIQNFDSTTVSVIKDPADNYGALVDYEFQIVTPLYTISITQHMKV